MTEPGPRLRGSAPRRPGPRQLSGLLVLALVVPAGGMRAQSTTESAARGFVARLDQNGDGVLTRMEWQGSSSAFLQYDRDLDGYLTLAELEGTGGPAPRPAAPGEVDEPVALGSFEGPPPAVVERLCTRCHTLDRVLETAVGPPGWAPVVAAMRVRSEGAIAERDAARITELLEARRREVVSGAGSRRARDSWIAILLSLDFAGLDLDRDQRLSGRELALLLLETLDFDGDQALDQAEYGLMPGLEDPEAEFRREDRDRNGRLSLRELGVPDALLESFDRDRDRELALDEWPGSREGPAALVYVRDTALLLELLDRDRDGSLEADAELAVDGRLLRLADADRSGTLDGAELDTALAISRDRVPEAHDGFLRRHDLDGDGKVGRAEFPAGDTVFRRCDRNQDGWLTAADRAASRR